MIECSEATRNHNATPDEEYPIPKRVVITADSTCDLSPELWEQYDIHAIPLTITLGDKSFADSADFTTDELYRRYDEDGLLPQTSAPSLQQYTDFFAAFLASGCEIVHLTISAELSSSYANACIVAKAVGGIHVVDSRMLSCGVGLLALKGAELCGAGVSAPEIAERLRSLTSSVRTSFVLDTLEYMRKGGRCSAVAAIGSNLLHIKPALSMKEGRLQVYKKYRGGMERVYRQYIEDCLAGRSIDHSRVFLAESGNIDEGTLAELEMLIRETAGAKELHRVRAGCTISSHCGPRTIGLFFLEA